MPAAQKVGSTAPSEQEWPSGKTLQDLLTPAVCANLKPSVKDLSITQMPLEGTFPEELYDFSRLEDLSLQQTNITGQFSERLGTLKTLKGMWTWDTKMTGPLPLDALAELQLTDGFYVHRPHTFKFNNKKGVWSVNGQACATFKEARERYEEANSRM